MRPTTVVNGRKVACDVFIGRGSKWGNPFKIGEDGTREECIEKFRKQLMSNPVKLAQVKRELRGRILGCYCKPLACHGDVLAEIADA